MTRGAIPGVWRCLSAKRERSTPVSSLFFWTQEQEQSQKQSHVGSERGDAQETGSPAKMRARDETKSNVSSDLSVQINRAIEQLRAGLKARQVGLGLF